MCIFSCCKIESLSFLLDFSLFDGFRLSVSRMFVCLCVLKIIFRVYRCGGTGLKCTRCGLLLKHAGNLERHYRMVHGEFLLRAGHQLRRARVRPTVKRKGSILKHLQNHRKQVSLRSLCGSFGFSRSTVMKWYRHRHLGRVNTMPQLKRYRSHRTLSSANVRFPDIDALVYQEYIFRREVMGVPVHENYLKRIFLAFLRKLQPPGWDKVKASNGWIHRFKKRHRITAQRYTDKKSLSALQLVGVCRKWHQFLYRIQLSTGLNSPRNLEYGRFAPETIFNVDQVPLYYGAKIVSSLNSANFGRCILVNPYRKADRYRLATLVLTLRGGGEQIVAPMLIFAGLGHLLAPLLEELRKEGIPFLFQPRAWADGPGCQKHLQYLIWCLKQQPNPANEHLLVLDNFSPQKTAHFQAAAKFHNIHCVYTPPNTTQYLQPVDHHVGAYFKHQIQDHFEQQLTEEILTAARTARSLDTSVQVMRVHLLRWVKKTWEAAKTKHNMLAHAFTTTGVVFKLHEPPHIKITGVVDDTIRALGISKW